MSIAARASAVLNVDILSVSLASLGVDFHAEKWIERGTGKETSDARVVINWIPRLSHFEGDEDYAEWSTLIRSVAAAWLLGIPEIFPPSAFTSVRHRVGRLADFCAKMHRLGHRSLDDVSPHEAERWVQERYPASPPGIRAKTVRSAMQLLTDIYRMRKWLTGGLKVLPFSSAFRRRMLSQYSDGVPWEAPPEPVCMYLIRESIRLLGAPADDLARLLELYSEGVEEGRRQGVPQGNLGPYAKRSLANFQFSKNDDGAAWTDTSPTDLARVAQLFKIVQAACFVAITYTSGPRMSEVRRAAEGCLVEKRHANGVVHFYYQAARSKQPAARQDASDANLLPAPWHLSPAGVRALRVLECTSAPLRRRANTQSYWVGFSGSGLWPRLVPAKGFHILSPTSLNVRLNRLARFISLKEKTGWTGKLHSHMGRKCLARFVAKRDRRGLEDLAIQYAHMTAESVDIGYARPDGEYRRMITKELWHEFEQIAQAIANVPATEVFHNRPADEVTVLQERLANFSGSMMTARSVKRSAAHGGAIFPGQWGACTYNPEFSACGGDRDGPSAHGRTPMTCKTCKNFLSLPMHSAWWERYRSDCKDFLSTTNLPAQSRGLVEHRLKQAEDVLSVISGGPEIADDQG